MTKAYERYLECREDLLRIRTLAGGYWSEDEEPVIEEMDELWSRMEPGELAAIRAEGSWKFPPPPAVAEVFPVDPRHGLKPAYGRPARIPRGHLLVPARPKAA